MNTHSNITITFLLLLVAGCASKSDSTTYVAVNDIGKQVTLVGRLGQPLGTVVKIKARWERPQDFKDTGAWRLNVLAVNGVALGETCYFHIALVETVKHGSSKIINS